MQCVRSGPIREAPLQTSSFVCAASGNRRHFWISIIAMTSLTIFDLCTPRHDVLSGTSSDSDFAADLSHVIKGQGPDEYIKPHLFFANTYPTRGLKSLLANVCTRLSGAGGAVSATFR